MWPVTDPWCELPPDLRSVEKRLLNEWYKRPYPPSENLCDNITRILSGLSKQDNKELLEALVKKGEPELVKAVEACIEVLWSRNKRLVLL